MSRVDSTGINFVKPSAHTVAPLACPACGSADVKPYQAITRDESNEKDLDECLVAAAHFKCEAHGCGARLTIRIERHAVSLKWSEA
jgi:hypothetical protein